MRDYGCIAGINTIPFDPVSAKEGEKRTCAGVVISGGSLISPPAGQYDALVIYGAQHAADRRAAIISQADIVNPDEIAYALGGFFTILEQGKLPRRLLSNNGDLPRHPRSAAGISADGKILYLLVIDGRRPGSLGATEAETGLILKCLGADWGLNFDGGGSSAMALRFSNGKVKTVNKPIHGGIPGRERAVAACLGFDFIKVPPIP